VGDLLRLGALEEEIIGRYLTLTGQILTWRDKEVLCTCNLVFNGCSQPFS